MIKVEERRGESKGGVKRSCIDWEKDEEEKGGSKEPEGEVESSRSNLVAVDRSKQHQRLTLRRLTRTHSSNRFKSHHHILL